MQPIPVPMALRARPTFPLGPFQVTLRTVFVVFALGPAALGALQLPTSGGTRVAIAFSIIAMAYLLSLPEREGLWIGTYLCYRVLERSLPRVVRDGRGRAASVRRIGARHLEVGAGDRPPLPAPGALSRWTTLTRMSRAGEGLLERTPGSWCALLRLEGPAEAPQTAEYAAWCGRVMAWLNTVDCPAQLYVEASHCERAQAEQAFLERVRGVDAPLVEHERRLAGEQALSSLVLRHYVLLFPRWAGRDGIPTTARVTKLFETANASESDASRARDVALRQAANLRLDVTAPGPAAIEELMRRTPLGCAEATFVDGEGVLAGRHHRYASLCGLPSTVQSGCVISALTRAHVQGGASLFIFPVDPSQARKALR